MKTIWREDQRKGFMAVVTLMKAWHTQSYPPFKQGASKLTPSSHMIRKRIYIAPCIPESNVDFAEISYSTCCCILLQDNMREQQGRSASQLLENSPFNISPTDPKRHDQKLSYISYVRHG